MQILIEIPSTRYPFGELFGNAISNLQDHRISVSVSIWDVGWSRKKVRRGSSGGLTKGIISSIQMSGDQTPRLYYPDIQGYNKRI